MSKIDHRAKSFRDLPLLILSNILTLSTSGFGVVVALAWNEAIQSVVKEYIRPWLGEGSGIATLFIYAIVITVLAVLITIQLAQLQNRLEMLNERAARRKSGNDKS